MNAKYPNNPELIATLRAIDGNGDEDYLGDKLIGVQVQQDKRNRNGLVQIDVRDFKRGTNLIIEIELPELAAALSLATLNAERNLDAEL